MPRSRWIALALLLAGPACAQLSGSVSLLSDDRYRGVSLSAGAPTAQLALGFDSGDGAYAGLQFARVRFAHAGAQVQSVAYLGSVRTLRPGVRAELGAQYTAFATTPRYDYAEFYVGVSGDHVGTRLAWMPRYYGQARSWYAELNGSHPLHGDLRATAHLGALRTTTGYADATGSGDRWRFDATVGLAIVVEPFDLELSWGTHSNAVRDGCASGACRAGNAWVLRVTRSW